MNQGVQIRVLARGVYPLSVLPPELARALEEEVKRHMTGYGFKEVLVKAEDATGESGWWDQSNY